MKPLDKFWEYANQTGKRFRCKFCKNDFAGGITRVKSHLSGIKGRDIVVCPLVPEDVQALVVLDIGEVNSGDNGTKRQKTKSSSGSVCSEGNISNLSGDSVTVLKQTSIPRMINKKDKEAVDMKVALCFFSNNIPFNVIQTPGFIEMAKAISDYGIGYALPSYSTLRTKLVVNTRAAVELYVNEVKESW
ncbi:hypothetical protein MKX03_021437, partial [Papaver bracteatum]